MNREWKKKIRSSIYYLLFTIYYDRLIRARRRKDKDRAEAQRLRKLLQYETELWAQGINLIAEVDEAGWFFTSYIACLTSHCPAL